MKRSLPFLIIIVVLAVAVGAAAYYMKRSAQESPSIPAGSPAPNSSAPTSSKAETASPGAVPPHARGPANAPVTLEEFGDFECPPCGLFHPVLKSTENEFGPSLRVIFREFPLTPAHPHALAAARAAEAAGIQGKFFEMHDLLYENQKSWKDLFDVRPVFEEYARRVGLDVERWKSDQTGEVVERRIFLDGTRAHSLGVKGTPTVFINGTELPYEELTPEGLRAAINKAMSAGR